LRSSSDPSLPVIVWVGGAVPGAWLAWRFVSDDLGANPLAEVLNASGELAIKSLLLCLACTPLRIVFGMRWVMPARKHLGLLAAIYAFAHAALYVFVDRYGEWATLWADVLDRPFILVGAVAATLLVPLSVTSFARVRRRMHPRAWVRLHKLVFAVGVLAVVHYVLRAKKDVSTALAHGAVLALLLLVRAYEALRPRLPTD
jgi:sulfoxide reductase heme-binding subunit YedZ